MAAKKKKAVKKAVKKAAPKKTAAKKAVKKTAAKKAVKKTAAKKAPAKKAAAAKPAKKKTTAITEKYSKTQIMTEIAENTELSKKEVSAVFDELADLIDRHVKKRGCGEFVLPGILKIATQRKPAVKARKGINPFTGEETMFKAKPARNVVKVRPLKKLKEMVE